MIQMHLLSVQMDDVYENINDYNPIRKRKKLVVFDDMIANIMDNFRPKSYNCSLDAEN